MVQGRQGQPQPAISPRSAAPTVAPTAISLPAAAPPAMPAAPPAAPPAPAALSAALPTAPPATPSAAPPAVPPSVSTLYPTSMRPFVPRKTVAELRSPGARRARERMVAEAAGKGVDGLGNVTGGLVLESVVLRDAATGDRTTVVLDGAGRNDPRLLADTAAIADGGGIARDALRKLAHLDPSFARSYRVREQIVRLRGARRDPRCPQLTPERTRASSYTQNTETAEMAAFVPVLPVKTAGSTDSEAGAQGPRVKDELEAYRRPLPLLLRYLIDHHQLFITKHKKGETLHLRLSGDGREVGRGRHNLMVTVAVLNVGADLIMKPDHHHTVLLTSGHETYEEMSVVLQHLVSELRELMKNGLTTANGPHPVIAYLSGDWKFLNTVIGLSSATAAQFCPWCLCDKDDRRHLDQENTPREFVWIEAVHGAGLYGHIRKPLLDMIPPDRIFADPLHLFLRLSDTILGLFLERMSTCHKPAALAELLQQAIFRATEHTVKVSMI
jgi:hypothetical protein